MINGCEDVFVSQERLKGFIETLNEHNISIKKEWIVNGAFEEAKAEEVTYELLQKTKQIDALFCASDLRHLEH
jgi:LacI family transcriptional regulator